MAESVFDTVFVTPVKIQKGLSMCVQECLPIRTLKSKKTLQFVHSTTDAVETVTKGKVNSHENQTSETIELLSKNICCQMSVVMPLLPIIQLIT